MNTKTNQEKQKIKKQPPPKKPQEASPMPDADNHPQKTQWEQDEEITPVCQAKVMESLPVINPVSGGDYEKECEKNKPPKEAKEATEAIESIPLPKAIGEENSNACNRYFRLLTNEQKKKVVLVFKHSMQKGRVNSVAGYFITLAKAAKNDELTVPSEAIAKVEPSPEAIAKEKEKQRRYDLWSKYSWLQENAARQETDMEVFAQQMGLEAAYEMYHETASVS